MIGRVVAIILALAGVPLFAVMGAIALASYLDAEMPLSSIMITFYQISEMQVLPSLPLFAFGGYVLAASRAPNRLLRVANALLGWMPGGLSIVAICASTMVTAVTGASGVTIVALGGLLMVALEREGVGEHFRLGLVTTGGSLGLLFPPSLAVILYGVVSRAPVEDLFLAGLIPGLLIVVVLSTYAALRTGRLSSPRQPFSWKELGLALREAAWEVPLPVVLILGIYTGFFTVSEAAVVGAAYIVVVEVFVYRDLRLRDLGAVARDSAVLVGGILIILGMTMAVTNFVIDNEIPRKLFDSVTQYMTNKYAFLVSLNVFLLLVGCMIDIYAAIVLIVPLMIPIAEEFAVDPVHLGIVFLVNMGIGYATPPVGINLFIASVRFEKPILRVYWACLPFIILLLIVLAVLTFVPALSLFLVR